MRIIGWNSQRDNLDFKNLFYGWQQCFSTSVFMLMSFYSDKFNAFDDKKLSEYVDDVCNIVGNGKGIAEETIKNHPEIKGNSAYWWEVQKDGLQKWLSNAGVKGNAVFSPRISYNEIIGLLAFGPVVIGTDKLGGLPGGHIILAVDKAEGGLIVNDPYGDAMSFYKIEEGGGCLYPEYIIKQHLTGNALFWRV